MGVSLGIDLSKLDVCFGGFSPTVMGDAIASYRHAQEAEERIRLRFESKQRALQVEQARQSSEQSYKDSEGNEWAYVEIDGQQVRITQCKVVSGSITIPSSIDGKPVVGISHRAFADQTVLISVTVPSSVVFMGGSVFQGCKNLEEVTLPDGLAIFQSSWFRGCPKLERLTLPGNLAELTPAIFDIPDLKHLIIGSGTQDVMPGTFAKSQLESITIRQDNPFMKTDGAAIYSADGRIMACLAIPVESYEVAEGCQVLGKKSFSNMASVQRVELPESLEVIGPFAMANTSIKSFAAPDGLLAIEEKAFFNCESLEEVCLNNGLKEVGANAFTNTKISKLELPASIEQLGFPVANKTNLIYSGPNATFTIAPGASHLQLDEHGALYRRDGESFYLMSMVDPDCEAYSVATGTISIDHRAFDSHPSIQQVSFPESLRHIGEGAFRNCQNLKQVNLNEGLERIEDEAFIDSRLEEVHIPASLTHIGRTAFVTRGAHHGKERPALKRVTVHPDNATFYMDGPLLLERKNDRTSKVVLFAYEQAPGEDLSPESLEELQRKGIHAELLTAVDVHIPSNVDEVAPYAFNGADGIRSLHMSDKISTVGIRGLAADCQIQTISIDLTRPVEGHDRLEVSFPDTTRGTQQMLLALGTSNFVNPEAMMEHYDTSILNASSFDYFSERSLGLYEQATGLMARLADPIFLSKANADMARRIIRKNLGSICVEISKHNDRKAIDMLVELGFLNRDNIIDVIDRVGSVQDASMTGYLLEVSRRLNGIDALDFDL